MDYKGYRVEVLEHIFGEINNGARVKVNGIRFPRGEGQYYNTASETKAIEWAIAEYQGKYLSRGGVVYESKAAYDAHMETIL